MKKAALFGKIILLITTVIWGSSFFILKNTLDDYPTFFVLAVRFSMSAALLCIVFIKKMLKITKKALLHGLLLGITISGAYALQTLGLKYTTPAKNAFLTAFYVVLVPLIGWFMLRKRPKVNNIIAAIMSIVGLGLVTLEGDLSIGLGEGLTIACGLFYALQIIFIAKYAVDDDPMQLLVVQLAVTGIVFWIVSLSAEKIPTGISFGGFLPILYLSIVATALAQLFQMVGQKYAPPNSAALILSLESVFGTIFSVIFYKEKLALQTILGFVIIFFAVLIGETDWTNLIGKIKNHDKENNGEERTNTVGVDECDGGSGGEGAVL